MIKHRFIVRGADDFRVFAAIPVEHTLLTWEKWVRPNDPVGLLALVRSTGASFSHAHGLAESAVALSASIPRTAGIYSGLDAGVANIQQRAQAALELAKRLRVGMRVFVGVTQEALANSQIPFIEAVREIVHTLTQPNVRSWIVGRDANLGVAENWIAESEGYRQRPLCIDPVKDQLAIGARFYLTMSEIGEALFTWSDLAAQAGTLVSSDPAVLPPCPVGLPFAIYTVEYKEVIVNVIEGKAWIEGRDATPDERTVTEIVSQMLTEHHLNPKAPTKIPVRETDPKHTVRVREAEAHDDERSTGATKLRTIKFEVFPPRYLREAAERILTSPRRAHWVIGHWRDQPYGTRHLLRRETWIKPHIRGLGEAGAVVARVTADHQGASS